MTTTASTATGTAEPRTLTRVGDVAPPSVSQPAQLRVKALARFATTLTIFNILGHTVLGFEQAPVTPIVAILTSYASAILFESLDAWAADRKADYLGGWLPLVIFLLPAHITGLACGMLLWGNASLWPYIFAIVVANGTKYVVRIHVNGRLRHVLNPSNAGITITLILFPWVGIAPPYHFTSFISGTLDWLLPLGILMFGTMLNLKLTGKIPLIAGWLLGFVAQAVVRWALLDHSLLGALVPMTGLAFVVFTNYMITDPATTPVRPRNQVVFGLVTAAVYGVLVVSEISFGLFFALVITCVLRGLVLVVLPRVRVSRS